MEEMKTVPFYSNTKDDTHCVQAVFRMALKHFLPTREYSWKELDRMTQKETGKGTWWFPAVPALKNEGLAIAYIESFDYAHYYRQGESYLNKFYGPEIAEWFLQNSNLLHVKNLIPSFLDSCSSEVRAASLNDIDKLLKVGWLVGVEINTRVLQNRSGFNGHMVLVIGRQESSYLIHDPGLPAYKAREISVHDFVRSWAYTGAEKTSLIGFNKA